MIPAREERRIPSPFRRLLLTDVYDGPTAGLAIDVDGAVYAFRMLDWDDSHHVRVFSVAVVPGINWRDAQAAFRSAEPEDWTEWVLPSTLPPLAEEALQRAETLAEMIAVVATSDLLDSIEVWRPATAVPSASPTPRWLEELGLARCGPGST